MFVIWFAIDATDCVRDRVLLSNLLKPCTSMGMEANASKWTSNLASLLVSMASNFPSSGGPEATTRKTTAHQRLRKTEEESAKKQKKDADIANRQGSTDNDNVSDTLSEGQPTSVSGLASQA